MPPFVYMHILRLFIDRTQNVSKAALDSSLHLLSPQVQAAQLLVAGCHPPPPVTFRRVAVSLRGAGQSPVLPLRVESGRCVLLAAAACVPDGVVCRLAEPSSWCTGVVLVVAGVVCRVFAVHSPPHPGCPPFASPCFLGHDIRRAAVSSLGPGQPPVLPFVCCVGSLCPDGRCGPCSLWCHFRISGAH